MPVHGSGGKLFSASPPAPPVVQYSFPFTYPVSSPAPERLLYPPGLLHLDLNIYRESVIKTLIKEKSDELYRLIKKVHFDGKYYRVKCMSSGEWEYCWDLAVRVQFFGMIQGLAFEPEKIVSKKDGKIIYRSLVLVNPYELWEMELVEKLWNLQDRIEFLIAKILFHECIHILIFLGKTLPSSFTQTDIFLELYEFLIHEKYSIKKTDLAFGLSWSNRKVSRDYAKITTLKIGPCPESNKRLWKNEVNRLGKNLKELYDRIDSSQGLDVR